MRFTQRIGRLDRNRGAMRETPSAQVVSMANSKAMKVSARMANCGANGVAGFRNCGKKAAKKSTALGLLAPTRKPRKKKERSRAADTGAAVASKTAASLRKVLMPR